MIKYYWSKLFKKMSGTSVLNTVFEKPSRAEAGSIILNSSFGRYSFCGYDCLIINCSIGRFTSLSNRVIIGNAQHPLEWVSTSPAFYRGRDGLPKNLAKLEFESYGKRTYIGNDVWIGEGVFIKGGVTIGDGAVVGMGSIVTKDIPPYAIFAGNPARLIRMRFSEQMISKLIETKWWNMEIEQLEKIATKFNNPQSLLESITD